MENMKLVDAGMDGSVSYEMTIAPNFSNLNSKNLPSA
jgi:acyl-coenzyme A thioesterase 13